MRMSRFNELSALLAAGVPLRRVAMPLVLAAALLNLALLPLVSEVIVPATITQLTRERGATRGLGAGESIQGMPEGPASTVSISQYFPATALEPAHLTGLWVVTNINSQIDLLYADSARWDQTSRHWTLTKGQQWTALSPQSPPRPRTPVAHFSGTTSPESLALFVSRGDFVDLLSTRRINQLLQVPGTMARVDLLRVRDARWASLVLNIVMVLLTIPCVLTRQPAMLQTSTLRVFVLIGACMACVFITQNMAGRPPANPQWMFAWPAMMAWLPLFLFAPLSVYMLDRIKS
jgi:lipopolysaccharide export LptBFGC system permease protein LptF